VRPRRLIRFTMEIRIIGDPALREMSGTLAASPGRVGLAAPQVGVLKRIFIYDLGHGPHCMINPELVETEDEAICQEGCLSIPGIYVSVPRFQRVKVKCTTLSGHKIVLEAEGFTAQVMQHECDHLEGVLILDRCDPEEKKRALAEFQQLQIQREQATA
jgi:peptide deformylase